MIFTNVMNNCFFFYNKGKDNNLFCISLIKHSPRSINQDEALKYLYLIREYPCTLLVTEHQLRYQA